MTFTTAPGRRRRRCARFRVRAKALRGPQVAVGGLLLWMPSCVGRCYAPIQSRMCIATYFEARRQDASRAAPGNNRVLEQRGTSSGGRRGSPHAHDGQQLVVGDEAVELQIAGMKDLQQGEQIAE